MTDLHNELDAQVERICRLARQIEVACSELRQQVSADIQEIKASPIWKRWENAARDTPDDGGSD